MSLLQKEHISRLLECFPIQHGIHAGSACPRCPPQNLVSFGCISPLSFLLLLLLALGDIFESSSFLADVAAGLLVSIHISSSISRQAHVISW